MISGLAGHDVSKMKEWIWSGLQSFNREKGGAVGGQRGALQCLHASPHCLQSISCPKSTGTIKFLRSGGNSDKSLRSAVLAFAVLRYLPK